VYALFLYQFECFIKDRKMPKIFWEIHSGLQIEGPGDNESTLKAYMMLKGLSVYWTSVVVEECEQSKGLNCSSGLIDALDNHQMFLE
jgi:hypothetical protein